MAADAFGIDREEIAKGLKIFKPRMGLRPSAPGIVNTEINSPGIGSAFAGMARNAKKASAAESARKGQQGMASAFTGINNKMRPRTVLKPSDAAVSSASDTVNQARLGVRARADRRRKIKTAGYIAGGAAASGGSVVAADKISGRKKKK